jgi:hypothetical protein
MPVLLLLSQINLTWAGCPLRTYACVGLRGWDYRCIGPAFISVLWKLFRTLTCISIITCRLLSLSKFGEGFWDFAYNGLLCLSLQVALAGHFATKLSQENGKSVPLTLLPCMGRRSSFFRLIRRYGRRV